MLWPAAGSKPRAGWGYKTSLPPGDKPAVNQQAVREEARLLPAATEGKGEGRGEACNSNLRPRHCLARAGSSPQKASPTRKCDRMKTTPHLYVLILLPDEPAPPLPSVKACRTPFRSVVMELSAMGTAQEG